MRDAILLDRPEGQQFLPCSNLALDHPVKRAAIKDFLCSLGRHAGHVDEFRLLALGPFFLESLFLPTGEFRKTVTANAKLDDMKRHDPGPIRATIKKQRDCRLRRLVAPCQ
jgi:hypothetical protein